VSSIGLFVASLIDHWFCLFGGFVSVGFALYEKYRRKETPSKIFWGLAALCVLMAAYQAWLDQRRNVATLTEEKANLTSKYTECSSDLRAKDGGIQSLTDRLGDQRSRIDSQQGTIERQQTSVNSCVVTLGKIAQPEPQKINLLFNSLDFDPLKGKHVQQLIAVTNRSISPVRMSVQCNMTVSYFSSKIAGVPGVTGGPLGGRPEPNNSYSFEIDSPPWTPTSPVVIDVYYDGDTFGTCGMTLR